MWSHVLWCSSWTFQPMKMRPLQCVKTSVMHHNIQEGCLPHPHHSKKLKTCIPLRCMFRQP